MREHSNLHGVEKTFFRYVSQNILGMIGISAYVLADTYFIAQAEGGSGITALNLVLPLYSLMFALSSMLGVGSATRFTIQKARKEPEAEDNFSNAILFGLLFGLIFMALGWFLTERMLAMLGGDPEIVAIGTPYTRTFLLFAPFFMWNYICNAFVRNDGNPALAMAATLSSSLFNIVMDYLFMFPLGLGMTGAALATAISPLVGIAVCGIHLCGKRSGVRFRWIWPSFSKLAKACPLGISSFVGELSSGVTTMIFNFLLLELAGNDGVAAYGIVANVSIVVAAIFNGVAQGSQPLLSAFYGIDDRPTLRRVLRLSIGTASVLAVLLLLAVNLLAEPIVVVFNSEGNQTMAAYAMEGIRLYFIGFLFAGFNLVGSGFLSATEAAKWAFFTSILRGFVAIAVCAVVLAKLLGIPGVWMAFPAAELLTAVVMCFAIVRGGENGPHKKSVLIW